MKQNQRGFSLFETIFVLGILLIIIGVGLFIFSSHKSGANGKNSTPNNSNINEKSNSESSNTDYKTEEDLTTINTVLTNYLSSPSNINAGFPTSLAQFNFGSHKFNFNLKSYKFSSQDQQSGGGSWQICANFMTDTFSTSTFGNYLDSIVDGSKISDYSVHAKGQQCYSNIVGGFTDGQGFDIVLNNNEATVVNNACGNDKSGQSWCTSNSYSFPQ
jgi:hypothetical protein